MSLSRLVPMQPVAGMPASVVFYEKLGFVVESRNDDNDLILPELEATFYGMTEFRIEDPDGNRLWIGQEN